ncbi:hypothetical protein OAG20_01800, partial [Verrucomicrobiales bacterium]|nr:hypothetical protein [Verrucomicrobiales bacterium]
IDENMAHESELAPPQRLTTSFLKAAVKIVAFCTHRTTSAIIEWFNNLTLRIVHWACGITNPSMPGSNPDNHPSSNSTGALITLGPH